MPTPRGAAPEERCTQCVHRPPGARPQLAAPPRKGAAPIVHAPTERRRSPVSCKRTDPMTINWDEAFNSPRPQHLLGPRPPRHTRRLQPLRREGKALASPHICHLKPRLQQTTWGNDGHRTPALNQGGLPPPPKKGKEPPLTSSDALDRGEKPP